MKWQNVIDTLRSPAYLRPFRPIPFWSWNDELDKKRLCEQIEWMHEMGIGGFFMHARGGLITEYLGEEWMQCCDVCCEKAAALDMDAYMYDENGWPSGFAGGKLLSDENNRDQYLTHTVGEYDPAAFVSYEITASALKRTSAAVPNARHLNVYRHIAVSTVDILNPDVVEKFLTLTHRAYKKRYGKKFSEKLKGFFTDEPQYFRWNTSYTPMIAQYFREKYNEDILDNIGLLFAEKDGYEAFRYKYWSGMRALFLENFAKKLYDFCEENHMSLTGHYVEESSLGAQIMCCGGTMPFYEYEHIPGIDWLGRAVGNELAVKQVGSAAAQTGKNRILTESFGCCGWDVTPRELKRILDFQYLGGVNILTHHLLPSSEYGQRKRDYPQHYTPLNPWIQNGFREFNDYFTRLGALIGHSTENVNVCLLHPITGAYVDYKRNEPDCNIRSEEQNCDREIERLASEHIPHHYVDEVLLQKMGKAKNGTLICGACKYDYVLIPTVKTLAKSTLALLEAYVKQGGKLFMMGDAPTMLEGVPFRWPLGTNCTWQEIRAAQPYTLDNPALRSSMRTGKEGTFVFVINPSDKEQTYTLTAGDAQSVRELRQDTVTFSDPLPLTRTLRPGQSALLFPSTEKPADEPAKPVIRLHGAQRLVSATQNTLMIDKARFAREGENFGEPTELIRIFAQLLGERYAGKLRLQYEFESRIAPKDIVLYAEDMNTECVEINGIAVTPCGTLSHEDKVLRYDVAPLVRRGNNSIVITVNYYQSDDVYYALFGEGVTESLRNCMVYNTNLESVYLAGDFGVYPVNAQPGETDATLRCDGFAIDARKTEIREPVTDGFAAFAGDITLESEIECGKEGCLLQIDGRWQTAVLEINGKTRKLLFDTAADVSDMVHPGKNTVRVTLTTSLRNLLGPHHFIVDEPTLVGPETFDLSGTWVNGQSAHFRPTYALVKINAF